MNEPKHTIGPRTTADSAKEGRLKKDVVGHKYKKKKSNKKRR